MTLRASLKAAIAGAAAPTAPELPERCRALSFTVWGPPRPKQRPRVGRGDRVYTPAVTRAYEKHVRSVASVAVLEKGGLWRPALEDRYVLSTHFFFADHRGGDIDNCLKLVSDACNGAVWHDDRQVWELHVWRGIDKERPRVEVSIALQEAF